MYVYRILNLINNKCYIGQTRNRLTRRYSGGPAKKPSNRYLRNAYAKYGPENFELRVLCVCDSLEALNYWESVFIKMYKSNEKEFGYNLTSGGDCNFVYTEEGKENNRQAQLKYWGDPEARKAHSERKKKSCESEEVRERLALGQGARRFSVYDKITGEFIGSWINAARCGRDLGFSGKGVRACLNKSKKSYRGYVFYYPEDTVLFGEALKDVFHENRRNAAQKTQANREREEGSGRYL